VSYLPSGGATIPLLDGVDYYPFGPVKLVTFHNGRKLSKFYDQDYPIDKVISTAPTGLLIDAVPDVLGNLKSASSTVGASPPTRSFVYDALYRLTGVTNASGASLENYAYNRTGDRTSKTLSGQAAQTYTYNTAASGHRLQSVAGVARGYDANGNTIGRGDNARYTYSDANRLAEVCQPLACPASGSTHYRYFYDGRGQRALKQKVTAHGALTTTAFTYDEGGRLVYEVGSAGGTAYVYLDQVPVSVVTGGQVYYIETDQLGTPRQVATTNNGLRWSWDYFGTTFGETLPNENPSGLGNFTFNLRFPGQYYDVETGTHYNYFRDYEPQTGRYIESDPIGILGGWALTLMWRTIRCCIWIQPAKTCTEIGADQEAVVQ
jgi:RHS repeat-associated protein